eukprot:GHVL01040876.1.p1 GENE.GHVL01040876.1~~GHVL01040876.1.p1  ORF type:complete len:464 (+),score=94.85 GHVL01040876.1:166-1557(+)
MREQFEQSEESRELLFIGLFMVLRLDNNVIDEIRGLECLVHLIWLDLSFNRISKICGLSTLHKLLDLSLYSNKIQKIEDLDNCSNLEILSIGNNLIQKLDDLLYLRRMKNLRCLSLLGNPVSNHESFLNFIITILSQVVYLDYMIIDKKNIGGFEEIPLEIGEDNEEEGESDRINKQRIEYEFLGPFFEFEKLIFLEKCPAIMKIDSIDSLRCETVESLRHQRDLLISSLQVVNQQRQELVNILDKTIDEALRFSEESSKKKIKKHRSLQKLVEKEINKIEEGKSNYEISKNMLIESLAHDLEQLKESLLEIEIELQNSIQVKLQECEAEVLCLLETTINEKNNFTTTIEEVMETFRTSLDQMVHQLDIEFNKAKDDGFTSDDNSLSVHFGSDARDGTYAEISTFYDFQKETLVLLDGQVDTLMNDWKEEFVQSRKTEQADYHRKRVVEIDEIVTEMSFCSSC